jgi:hypothetical protein
MEGGVGIGRDLELIESSGSYPSPYLGAEFFIRAQFGTQLYQLRRMRVAAHILDKMLRFVPPESANIGPRWEAFKSKLGLWGNVSAICELEPYSSTDRVTIAMAAFARKKSMPTASDVRWAIGRNFGKIGIHEEDRRTRERTEGYHLVADTIKRLSRVKGCDEIKEAVFELKKSQNLQVKRSSKHRPRILS